MRVVFMGTPDFAVPALRALVEAGHEIAAVYCQPPRAAGRGKGLRRSPVEIAAEDLRLPVRTPASLRTQEEAQAFAGLGAEVAVVAAYGLILPRTVLAAPSRGCLNIHGSLLPRWRGAAPIQRAILAGDAETGVTIMGMEEGLDTGPMLACRATAIDGKTAGELTEELAATGAVLMVGVLEALDRISPEPQPAEGVTYASKIMKDEARLDFTRPAVEVERAVRAFNPAPGAFTMIGDERLKILAGSVEPGPDPAVAPGTVTDDRLTIACLEGSIRPTLVQRAGKAPMGAPDLLRGTPIPAGSRAM